MLFLLQNIMKYNIAKRFSISPGFHHIEKPASRPLYRQPPVPLSPLFLRATAPLSPSTCTKASEKCFDTTSVDKRSKSVLFGNLLVNCASDSSDFSETQIQFDTTEISAKNLTLTGRSRTGNIETFADHISTSNPYCRWMSYENRKLSTHLKYCSSRSTK